MISQDDAKDKGENVMATSLAHSYNHKADWMRTASRLRLFAALGEDKARYVGGCVRDSMLNLPFADIDVASQHDPDTNLRLLRQAGLSCVPTGLKHGTITVILPDGPVEVTSLREDLVTDGRHATVAFTQDWLRDAQRRDLSMNALYLGIDGRLFDPTGQGLEDALAGRVRFIGDPAHRIHEDYLRLLRYFRFAAKYGRQPLDADTLTVCARLAPQLERLSGERIAAETLKLLSLPQPMATLRCMRQHHIMQAVWADTHDLAALERLMQHDNADPVLRLRAWIGERPPVLAQVARRLRVSNAIKARLVAPLLPLEASKAALLQAAYRHGRQQTTDSLMLTAAYARHTPWPQSTLDWLAQVIVPEFPLKGRDLMAEGYAPGPDVGWRIKQTEAWWLTQDFRPDLAACLAYALALARPAR